MKMRASHTERNPISLHFMHSFWTYMFSKRFVKVDFGKWIKTYSCVNITNTRSRSSRYITACLVHAGNQSHTWTLSQGYSP